MTERFVVEQSPFARGVSLVEASAGTGKTFNIAMSIVRLLLECDQEQRPLVKGIGNILVVTFTVAATDELVTRIRTLLRQANEVYNRRPTSASEATVQLLQRLADGRKELARARVAAALAEVDTLAVFTIHGFCKRVLEEFALESGTAFGAALVEDDEQLLQQAMQHWWRHRFYDDQSLAGFAVSRKWQPTCFVDDYRLWSRFPDVLVEPADSLEQVRGNVARCVQSFATRWAEDGAAFRAQLAAMSWNKGAPCADASRMARLDAQIAEAISGDLAAAAEIAGMLSVEGLQKFARNVKKEERTQRAALADLALPQAATRLCAEIERLVQALRVDCFGIVRARLRDEKLRRNLLDFDDLLEQLSGVLAAQGPHGLLARAIRAQFHAALIDEFQDTDLHQFRIFDTAFHGHPLFLIGDPKQAIYAFRGADVHAYLAASEAAERRFTLDRNHRSAPRMVEAVNALFGQRSHAFVDDAITFHRAEAAENPGPTALLDGSHALHWFFVGPEERRGKLQPTSHAQAQLLTYAASVRHMKAQLAAGWRPRHLAVLVRTTAEGVDMAAMLREKGIPAVVSGLGNVLQSNEMAELHLVLGAIASPRQEARVRAALATSLWGADSAALLRLAGEGAEGEWDALLNDLATLRDIWLSKGTLQVLQSLFAARNVAERFMAYRDGDRRLTNLRHVTELVHGAAVADELNMDGVLRWMAMRRSDASREREVAQLRLDTDAEAVQILTIHKSKGLQFDIVYCPTLYRSFPLEPQAPLLVHEGGTVVFDHGSSRYDERTRQANVERLAEECRLAYVALTRAKFRTYVGWGVVGHQDKGAWHSALSYLLCNDPLLEQCAPIDKPGTVASLLKQDCERWEPMLRDLVARHPEHMALEVVDTGVAGATLETTAVSSTVLRAARELPPVPAASVRFDTYAVTSFSGLKSGARSSEAARDVDDAPGTGTFMRSPLFLSTRDLPPADFRSFPAGRREGNLLHTLFETSAFDDSVEVLRERVALRLMRTQLAADEGDPRIDAVVRMMRAVFETPLAPWPVHLAQVAPGRARHEWEFLLPFADAGHAFMRQRIADQFERLGGDDGVRYAARLRSLSGARVHGFLTGFVDLVFEHGGRWYVVDWKSNQLGAAPAAYARGALQEVMESDHYVLQYHLYLVALHRYLTARLPGYDYDRHMGGAAYAFLRGFEVGASATGHGWYTERPDRALIEALSALMERQGTGRAT